MIETIETMADLSSASQAPVEFDNQLTVELVEHSGSDLSVVRAARVSTATDTKPVTDKARDGLINYLMKHRHGTPFEHNSMTFVVTAPIFVFREFQRHRVGWSYNEQSARYTPMEPRFYLYPQDRMIVQEGSSAHPNLGEGTRDQKNIADDEVIRATVTAWESYNYMVTAGVAYEVARAVLPVNLYSKMYATCNARSLMSFLSLRVDDADAKFETKPQWEIEQVALGMEKEFEKLFPSTYKSFIQNGRVSP